ncbi:MAG: hypothetical protein M0Q21_11215 [Ignavibacteriaceae bacterium]|nr:hypothetical protein [Ignavibacteriaceae bacterium]
MIIHSKTIKELKRESESMEAQFEKGTTKRKQPEEASMQAEGALKNRSCHFPKIAASFYRVRIICR